MSVAFLSVEEVAVKRAVFSSSCHRL